MSTIDRGDRPLKAVDDACNVNAAASLVDMCSSPIGRVLGDQAIRVAGFNGANIVRSKEIVALFRCCDV